MANIQPEITAFKSAVYGEEVRDAMVSLANKLNSETSQIPEVISQMENLEYSKRVGNVHIHASEVFTEKGDSETGAYFRIMGFYIRGYGENGGGNKSISWNSFLPESHVSGPTPGGTFEDYIILPHNNLLVYDISDSNLKIIPYTSKTFSQVIILHESYGDIRGGLAMDPLEIDEIRNTNSSITSFKDSITEKTENINTSTPGPYYFSRSSSVPGKIQKGTTNHIGLSGLVEVEPNTDYSIRFFDGPDSRYALYYCFYDEDKTAYYPDCTDLIAGGVVGATVTSPNYAKYINVFTYGAEIYTNYPNTKIAIVEGEVIPSSYVAPLTAIDSVARNMASEKEKTTDIPKYWESSLLSAEETIRQLQSYVGRNGGSYILVTDTHWRNNAQISPALIRHVLEHTGVNMVVNGGDNLQGHLSTREGAIDEVMASVRSFVFPGYRCLGVYGNHDNNTNNNSGAPESHLNNIAEYSIINALYLHDDLVYSSSEDCGSYYYDNPLQKMRYIFLDWSATQADNTSFITSALSTLTSGWYSIVFIHGIYANKNAENPETYYDVLNMERQYVLDACQPYKDSILFFHQGHAHRDAIVHAYENEDTPILITTNDSLASNTTGPGGGTTYPKTRGTNTEQAFDIVVFDYSRKVASLVRVGAGESSRDISWS